MALASALLAQGKEEGKPDPRLDQKVSCQAKAEFLYKVLEDLTEKTGVVMECGKSVKDWQVREQKVNIFVKDYPLRDLQQVLADLLHFTWTSGAKDGERVYRIYQRLKAKKEEEKLRAQALEAKKRKEIARREGALSDLDKVLSLKPEEIEKLKDEDPMLYFLAKEPIGKGLAELARLVPEGRAAFLERRDFTYDLSNASAEVLEAARTYVKGYESVMSRIAPPDEAEDFRSGIAALAEGIQAAQIKVRCSTEEDMRSHDPMENAVLGWITIQADGKPTADMPLFDTGSGFGKAMGRLLLQIEQGASPESLGSQMEAEMLQAMIEEMRGDEKSEALPDDPELDKKIKLEPQDEAGGVMPTLLKELAKKSGLQIVSDQYPEENWGSPMAEITQLLPIGKEESLRKVIEDLAAVCGQRVKKTGSLLTFQDRKWFEKRAWAVPEATLERWRQKVEKNAFELEDAVDMACLTDDQLIHTVSADDKLNIWEVYNGRHVLRFYAVLSRAQRNALYSQAGLSAMELTEQQLPYFEYLLSPKGRGVTEQLQMRPSLVITLGADEAKKQYRFELLDQTVRPEGDEGEGSLRTWVVTLPGWEPPSPPEDSAPAPDEPGTEVQPPVVGDQTEDGGG